MDGESRRDPWSLYQEYLIHREQGDKDAAAATWSQIDEDGLAEVRAYQAKESAAIRWAAEEQALTRYLYPRHMASPYGDPPAQTRRVEHAVDGARWEAHLGDGRIVRLLVYSDDDDWTGDRWFCTAEPSEYRELPLPDVLARRREAAQRNADAAYRRINAELAHEPGVAGQLSLLGEGPSDR